MSDGKTHALYANRAALVIGLTGATLAITIHPVMAGVAFGGFVGKIVDPDLDHQWTTQSEQRVRRFNRVAGLLWSAYWTPYDWAHPHRGTSHTWPYGTLVRFLYALWPLIGLSLWLAGMGIMLLCWWVLVFVGLSVQDCLHLWMDREI